MRRRTAGTFYLEEGIVHRFGALVRNLGRLSKQGSQTAAFNLSDASKRV